MRKILRVIYVVLMVLAVIVTVLMINKSDNNYYNDETTETIKKFREFENHNELAYWVAIKNGDWSDLPLTDVFRKKYNEKDGIFGDMQFDKVEYRPYHNGKYPFEDFAYLVITQGKKKTAYTYSMDPDSGDGYNDIIIGSIYPLTDENGNELDFREGITKENFESQMYALAWGQEDEQLVGVTNAFHKKYPYFLDLFIHYSPLTFNHIEFVPERSSWERKEAYFIVNSQLECKKRYYKVKFTLDNRGYLDDVEVKKVNEIEYELEPLGWDYWRDNISPILVLIFKNSNYDIIKSTDSFKKKYNNENRLFRDANVIDYQQYDKLICLILSDCKKYYYIDAVLLDDEETVDDIVFKELPYGNISFEEAKELYLKEYNK